MRAYSICPRDWSEELLVPDAIAAVRASFPLTLIDAEQGRIRAEQVLDRLRSMNAPAAVQGAYVKGANDAVMVALNEESSAPFMLMSGEGIYFRCDEEALARKLAAALGYECVEL